MLEVLDKQITDITYCFFVFKNLELNIHHVKFCHENTRIQSFFKNEETIYDISNLFVLDSRGNLMLKRLSPTISIFH